MTRDRELYELLEATAQDVAKAEELLRTDNSPYARRMYVRIAYSSVEAFLSWLTHLALAEYESAGPFRFTPAQVTIFREESYTLDPKGRIQIQPRYVPLDRKVRFVLEAYLNRRLLPLEVDWGDTRWSDFRAGLKVRHRITHPKTPADLAVTEAELNQVKRGQVFVRSIVYSQLARALRYAEEHNIQLEIDDDGD